MQVGFTYLHIASEINRFVCELLNIYFMRSILSLLLFGFVNKSLEITANTENANFNKFSGRISNASKSETGDSFVAKVMI